MPILHTRMMRLATSMVVLAAAPVAFSVDLTQLYTTTTKGSATYDGKSDSAMGHCTLGPPSLQGLPQGIAGIRATTGIASELYALGGCGMCLRVNDDKGRSIDVYVNDECKTCTFGDLNLGVDGEGRTDITWTAIPCDTGANPITYVFQGSNTNYLKVQARTTRCPVKSMQVSRDGGATWEEGKATIDDFFTFSTPGYTFPLLVKTTSIFGETVQDRLNGIDTNAQPGLDKAQFLGCAAKAADGTAPAPAPVPSPSPAPAPFGNSAAPIPAANASAPAPAPAPEPAPVPAPAPAPAPTGGQVIRNDTTTTITTNGSVQTTQTCTTVVVQLGSV